MLDCNSLLLLLLCLFTVVRCLFIGVHDPCTESSVVFTEDFTLQNITFDTFIMFSGIRSRRTDCALLCSCFTACLSFVYNNMTKSCTTFSEIFVKVEEGLAEDRANYYKTIKGSGCPSTYTFNASVNMCFRIDQSNIVRTAAIADCQTEGGHLVKVDSTAKQQTLVAAYNPTVKNKYYISGKKQSGVYKFDDGTPITEFFWTAATDPKQYSHIFMTRVYNYKWLSGEGRFPRNFICEINVKRT